MKQENRHPDNQIKKESRNEETLEMSKMLPPKSLVGNSVPVMWQDERVMVQIGTPNLKGEQT